MSRDVFRQNCDIALTRIVDRLSTVSVEFGPADFPEDNGKRLRNRLCNFAYSFYQVIDYYCFDDSKDRWAKINARVMENASPEVLFSVAGSIHFYVESNRFVRSQSHRDEFTKALLPSESLCKSLDWLTNIYAVPPEVPVTWHNISTQSTSVDDFCVSAERYLENEIAFALGIPADERTWAGLALATDFAASCVDVDEWDAKCEEIFDCVD